MNPDYIPTKDADLVNWSANFSAVITATPTDYGLTSGQATSYATLDANFAAAYTVATNPATRTIVTVAAKDSARASLVAQARQLAQIAQKYPAITPTLLATAGLTVRNTVPSPIPAPTTWPILSLLSSASLQHTIRYKDSALIQPRGLPFGAVAIELYVLVGPTPPASIADCRYVGQFSRMPMTVNFTGADAGKVANYLCRYITKTGLTGPTSPGLSATVPA